MTDEANIEDVEQSENNEVRSLTEEPPSSLEEAGFEGFGIGDADTAEGQARRAEEAHFGEVEEDTDKVADVISDLEEQVEDLPPLPTAEEAEMGELCRVPSEGQFQFCELVDNDTPTLIGAFEEFDTPKGASDQEVREAVEAIEEDI
jgi:hypothetical protein